MQPLLKTTHQTSAADHFLLEAENHRPQAHQPSRMFTSRFFPLVVGIAAALVAAYLIVVNEAYFVLKMLSR
jgi:hypothetical protein